MAKAQIVTVRHGRGQIAEHLLRVGLTQRRVLLDLPEQITLRGVVHDDENAPVRNRQDFINL